MIACQSFQKFFSCHKIEFLFLKTPKTAAFSYILIENIQKMARKQLFNKTC